MKLHTKLYLFFAGIVILPLLVVTVAASVVLGRSAKDAYDGRLQSSLAAATALISAEAQGLTGDSQAALQRADVRALLAGEETSRITALSSVAAEARATGAVLRDPAGAAVASVGSGGPDYAIQAPQIATTIRLSRPDGSIWSAMLLRSFDAEALQKVFTAQGLEWGLVENGIVTAGSLPAAAEVRDENNAQAQAFSLEGTADALTVTVAGREMFASGIMLPQDNTNIGAALFTAVPASIVGASSRQALEAGLGLMLGVALMAGLLGLLMTRNITRPLRELTHAAAAGMEGDLDQKVEVRSNDEVGSLANSFGMMQKNIRDYISELEESRTQLLLALSYAGEILGSTSNRARLMKTAAEAARLATGADGIWVELFPNGLPPERRAVSTGAPSFFFDSKLKEQAVKLADRVASGSIAAGEVIEISQSQRVVAFPMMADNEALGAMVAFFDQGRPSEETRSVLATLTDQAAIAVENVNYGELQQLLATTDPMTGLFNFRFLCSNLDQEISKSRRYDRQLSVSIIDLDDFKAVNDTYGHQAGDKLLRTVAEVLASNVRDADMVARYGGEEFSIVFPETLKTDAMKVLEKLRKEIAAIFLEDYPDVRVTASIGLASYPDDGADKTELLLRADKALYQAKRSGKNRCIAA